MFPLIITYFVAFYSGRTSSISQLDHFLEISAIFPKISQKEPKFDFFACGWFFSEKVVYYAYFGGKTNFLSQLELIIKNPAIFSQKMADILSCPRFGRWHPTDFWSRPLSDAISPKKHYADQFARLQGQIHFCHQTTTS